MKPVLASASNDIRIYRSQPCWEAFSPIRRQRRATTDQELLYRPQLSLSVVARSSYHLAGVTPNFRGLYRTTDLEAAQQQ
jgi:hypothetical protein